MKIFRSTIVLLAVAALAPMAAFADTAVDVGQVVTLTTPVTAGDVVLCDMGAACSASTPAAAIAGVGVFYLSFEGPYTPDVGPANAVTLLGGSQLDNFLTNYPGGFSANSDYLDVAADGTATAGGFTFDTSSASSTAAPEPSSFILMGLGMAGLLLAFRFRKPSSTAIVSPS